MTEGSSMKKILVVDDEKSIREMIVKFLAEKGYQACSAADGTQALMLLKRERPDAVLLDIRMPGADGIETLKKIKRADKRVGVIMITAVSEREVAEQCLELGAFDYITKPISLQYLEECLLAKLMGS